MKRIGILLLALMMVLAMAGCGSSTTMAVDNKAAEMEMVADSAAGEILYASTGAVTGTSQFSTEQKLIKRVSIDAETEDLETLLAALSEKIGELGGYIEEQQLYNGSSYSSYRSRSASLTIRIPAEKLDGFVEQVKGISNVVNYNASQNDVTLTYVSTESRIKALQVEEERLLELLAKAENMLDLLEIEERLTEVRYELENVTSQLRVLANQVDYATVELYISQVKVYTEVEPQTVWQRIGSGFKENLEDIGEDLTDFFVWAVTYSPQLIFWTVVIAVAVLVVKRRISRKKAKREIPKPENEEK